MQTIAIVSRKGGIAKTTTAQNLGAGLARRGYRILFIDLDSQQNLTWAVDANMAANITSMDVLTGTAITRAIQKTVQGDAVAASDALSGADALITGNGREYRLKRALEAVADKYDYAIIDTPAALGILTVNALAAANGVIIPAEADIFSLQGVVQLFKAINTVRLRCNPSLTIRGILITKLQSRAILSRDMQSNFDTVAEQLGTKVYKTAIRLNIAIKEAQAQRMDVFSYSIRSNGAKDYSSFIDEFMQD